MILNEFLGEAHHDYTNADYQTVYKAIKNGDTLRVYHGFRDMPDAVHTARYGLSGATRAPRVYSYEGDNNPKGLFVSTKLDIASEFAGGWGCIMEFDANVSELEPPVWPNGSYTVQGQMAQFFGHGAKGRANRNAARRAATADADADVQRRPEELAHIAQSDDRLLAYLLTNSREAQALFVGHLDPERITAFYVRADLKAQNRYNEHGNRLTREQFLEFTKEEDFSRGEANHRTGDMKAFKPGEVFNGEEFMKRMNQRYGSVGDRDNVTRFLKMVWRDTLTSKNKTNTFVRMMDNYLWPKQYIGAMQWMRDTFGRTPPE